MLDEEGATNLFNQTIKLWIEPELSRRRKSNCLPQDFVLYRCLIRLPRDGPPIVEFNDEIRWLAYVKKELGKSFEKGQRIYLHEIQKIVAVSPPEVEGRRVPFVYVFTTGYAYQILFDFTPNDEMLSAEEREAWQFGKPIVESLQAILVEKAIHIHDSTQAILQKDGLWAAPALLPYPLAKIVKQLSEGDVKGARFTLCSHCNPKFIQELTSKWWDIEQLQRRQKLILEALQAHTNGQYILSIHTLLPHIEGIITEWIFTRLPESEKVPWKPESKTKRFRDLVLDTPPTVFTYKRIVESAIDFIVSGPVLKSFTNWADQIDKEFPNRNVVAHGRYDESLFTEENSVKLFLLVDSIYYIMSKQKG